METDKDKGREYLDDTPVAVPVKFRGVVGQGDRLRQLMENLIVDMRDREGVESFEESLDFEDPDGEDDGLSHSETRYMVEEKLLQEHREADTIVRRRVQDANFKRRMKNGNGGAQQHGNQAGGKGAVSGGEVEAASGGKGGKHSGGEGSVSKGGGGSGRSGAQGGES